jgi:Arc/MetJ family transcription regulator|tara:strand:+ start:55 stop:261 length:207 start_codon:yes stop_codon:yes gene_type:complete
MMRTTLNVDEELLDEVVKATGSKSKSAAVSKVLEEYLTKQRIQQLRSALGTLDLNLDDWYEFRHMEPR